MKLTNEEIWGAREPLAKLITQKFPVKVSYNLAMMVSRLSEQLKVIDEVRNTLIKTYGEADKDNPNNTIVRAKSENFPKYLEEFAELMAKEAEINFDGVIVPVKLPEKVAATCDSCHHNMDRTLEIEPSTLMALQKFVEV